MMNTKQVAALAPALVRYNNLQNWNKNINVQKIKNSKQA